MSFRMTKFILFATAFALSLTIFSTASADNEVMSLETLERISQNIPELLDDQSKGDIRSSGTRMKCYVDTPAYDNFTYGNCVSFGYPTTTTAVFRVDNVPSNFTIIWSDSRCNSSSRDCFLPISHFQTINLSATALDNSNNTFTTTSASASYHGYY